MLLLISQLVVAVASVVHRGTGEQYKGKVGDRIARRGQARGKE
jgi:hypothetical protein